MWEVIKTSKRCQNYKKHMTNKFEITNKIFLGFLGVGAVLVSFLAVVLLYAKIEPDVYAAILAIGVMGIIAWIYLWLRISVHLKVLKKILLRLYEGDFDTAIKPTGKDELSEISHLLNKTINNLHAYDQLRAARVVRCRKIMSTLFRNMQEGVILIERTNDLIILNKTVQNIFGIDQDEISITSVIKKTGNYQFAQALEKVFTEKTACSIQTQLHMPIARAKKNVALKFYPVKDNTLKDSEEEINTVIVLLQAAQ